MSNTVKSHLTLKSSNVKTGPIPVSTTSKSTCPDACPLKGNGCYAGSGPLALHWNRVSSGELGMEWDEFTSKIATLPDGQLWRHNQAGDLPGEGNDIDCVALLQLVSANRGKRGYTYTHKPMDTPEKIGAIRHANSNGFTINLSANNLSHADELASLKCGPVAVILPEGVKANCVTPAGKRVVVCPAQTREGVTCQSCGLCAVASRSVIVGFIPHGTSWRKAAKVAA